MIGMLKSLKGLNFSHNMLRGIIPSSLSNLTNLEWLDLLCNKLVGESPLQLAYITNDLKVTNGFTWKVVIIGYGWGFVFGISCVKFLLYCQV